MTRRNLILLFAVLLSGPVALAKETQNDLRFITPKTYGREVELLVSGKRRPYYLLESGGEVEVEVKGPTKLHVLSRVILAAGEDSTDYAYSVRRKDAKKPVTMTHRTRISDKTTYVSDRGARVGLSRTKVIEVSRGIRSYVFTLPKSAKHSVLLRFAAETNAFRKGARVVAMTPSEFAESLGVVSGEENSTYYRISGTQPAAIQVIGPATMKVLSRIEFDSSMTGRQKWKVQVTEDGKIKATYALAARKSDVAAYRDPTRMVPSRAETFFVEIPEGSHRYEFRLPENHRTVIMRFLLPESQLARE